VTIVVDASVTAAWCFDDEATSYTEAVLARVGFETAIVPVIWSFEIANALLVGQRRGRLSEAQAKRVLQLLLDLPIAIDDTAVSNAWGPVLDLGRDQELASYDACYLELTMRLGLSLATIDMRQRDAAVRVGIPLVTAE
jgi:predicted nucleic acid-binding protein